MFEKVEEVMVMWGNQRTPAGVGSLLLPRGFQGLNSGQQGWHQAPLPRAMSLSLNMFYYCNLSREFDLVPGHKNLKIFSQTQYWISSLKCSSPVFKNICIFIISLRILYNEFWSYSLLLQLLSLYKSVPSFMGSFSHPIFHCSLTILSQRLRVKLYEDNNQWG